jgi:signal transduction histidine kinase
VVIDEEIGVLSGDDTRGVLRTSAAPIHDHHGTIVTEVTTFTDVTAMQQLERTREAFFRVAVHDLKAPLTAISATAQLARLTINNLVIPEAADLNQLLGRLDAAVGRMATLINDLAEVAWTQVGQEPTFKRQLTDLVALLRSAVAAQDAVAPGRIGVESAVSVLQVPVDAAQVERALTNLFTNAIKYSPRGEPIQVRIAPEDTPAGTVASIAVIDQGVGIPAADVPHVFEQFRRGSNVTGLFPGTGVGLAVTRQIVEAHGGQITVESQEGKGSIFVVHLPLGNLPSTDAT